MRRFTRPLIQTTFGSSAASDSQDGGDLELITMNYGETCGDLAGLINNADAGTVLPRLTRLAESLQLKLEEVPRFLEDFADIYLSVAYYESCYNEVAGEFDEFSALVSKLIRSHKALQRNIVLVRQWDLVEDAMTLARNSIHDQLALFDEQTRGFWNDFSAKRFREIEQMIKANHVLLGEILCGMTVKMTPWRRRFPAPERANPHRVAEFILSELGEGIEKIYNAASGRAAPDTLRNAGSLT